MRLKKGQRDPRIPVPIPAGWPLPPQEFGWKFRANAWVKDNWNIKCAIDDPDRRGPLFKVEVRGHQVRTNSENAWPVAL